MARKINLIRDAEAEERFIQTFIPRHLRARWKLMLASYRSRHGCLPALFHFNRFLAEKTIIKHYKDVGKYIKYEELYVISNFDNVDGKYFSKYFILNNETEFRWGTVIIISDDSIFHISDYDYSVWKAKKLNHKYHPAISPPRLS